MARQQNRQEQSVKKIETGLPYVAEQQADLSESAKKVGGPENQYQTIFGSDSPEAWRIERGFDPVEALLAVGQLAGNIGKGVGQAYDYDRNNMIINDQALKQELEVKIAEQEKLNIGPNEKSMKSADLYKEYREKAVTKEFRTNLQVNQALALATSYGEDRADQIQAGFRNAYQEVQHLDAEAANAYWTQFEKKFVEAFPQFETQIKGKVSEALITTEDGLVKDQMTSFSLAAAKANAAMMQDPTADEDTLTNPNLRLAYILEAMKANGSDIPERGSIYYDNLSIQVAKEAVDYEIRLMGERQQGKLMLGVSALGSGQPQAEELWPEFISRNKFGVDAYVGSSVSAPALGGAKEAAYGESAGRFYQKLLNGSNPMDNIQSLEGADLDSPIYDFLTKDDKEFLKATMDDETNYNGIFNSDSNTAAQRRRLRFLTSAVFKRTVESATQRYMGERPDSQSAFMTGFNNAPDPTALLKGIQNDEEVDARVDAQKKIPDKKINPNDILVHRLTTENEADQATLIDTLQFYGDLLNSRNSIYTPTDPESSIYQNATTYQDQLKTLRDPSKNKEEKKRAAETIKTMFDSYGIVVPGPKDIEAAKRKEDERISSNFDGIRFNGENIGNFAEVTDIAYTYGAATSQSVLTNYSDRLTRSVKDIKSKLVEMFEEEDLIPDYLLPQDIPDNIDPASKAMAQIQYLSSMEDYIKENTALETDGVEFLDSIQATILATKESLENDVNLLKSANGAPLYTKDNKGVHRLNFKNPEVYINVLTEVMGDNYQTRPKSLYHLEQELGSVIQTIATEDPQEGGQSAEYTRGLDLLQKISTIVASTDDNGNLRFAGSFPTSLQNMILGQAVPALLGVPSLAPSLQALGQDLVGHPWKPAVAVQMLADVLPVAVSGDEALKEKTAMSIVAFSAAFPTFEYTDIPDDTTIIPAMHSSNTVSEGFLRDNPNSIGAAPVGSGVIAGVPGYDDLYGRIWSTNSEAYDASPTGPTNKVFSTLTGSFFEEGQLGLKPEQADLLTSLMLEDMIETFQEDPYYNENSYEADRVTALYGSTVGQTNPNRGFTLDHVLRSLGSRDQVSVQLQVSDTTSSLSRKNGKWLWTEGVKEPVEISGDLLAEKLTGELKNGKWRFHTTHRSTGDGSKSDSTSGQVSPNVRFVSPISYEDQMDTQALFDPRLNVSTVFFSNSQWENEYGNVNTNIPYGARAKVGGEAEKRISGTLKTLGLPENATLDLSFIAYGSTFNVGLNQQRIYRDNTGQTSQNQGFTFNPATKIDTTITDSNIQSPNQTELGSNVISLEAQVSAYMVMEEQLMDLSRDPEFMEQTPEEKLAQVQVLLKEQKEQLFQPDVIQDTETTGLAQKIRTRFDPVQGTLYAIQKEGLTTYRNSDEYPVPDAGLSGIYDGYMQIAYAPQSVYRAKIHHQEGEWREALRASQSRLLGEEKDYNDATPRVSIENAPWWGTHPEKKTFPSYVDKFSFRSGILGGGYVGAINSDFLNPNDFKFYKLNP
jgi:hypothetical protein